MKMNAAELDRYVDEVFPELNLGGKSYLIEEVAPMSARVRLICQPRHLRPGCTISGPTMFALADVALYAAILGELGPVAMAVTTNLNINFLRRPEPGDLIGECRLFKLGKRLAFGEVGLRPLGATDLVAHATGAYSIPDPR